MLFLCAAALIKYTAVTVIIPIFIAVFIMSNKKSLYLKYLILPWLISMVIYVLLHPEIFNIGQEAVEKIKNRTIVINIILSYLNFALLPIILLPFYFFKEQITTILESKSIKSISLDRSQVILIIILITTFTIPSLHLYTGIFTSFVKQLVYSSFGVTAFAVYSFQGTKSNLIKLVLVFYLLLNSSINILLYNFHNNAWPNTSNAEKFITKYMKSEDLL